MTLLSEEHLTASKDYDCDASIWITEGNLEREYGLFTFSELRSLVKAKNNGWKIKKGEKYTIQICKNHKAKSYTFRAIPEIHNICIKYDLYEH